MPTSPEPHIVVTRFDIVNDSLQWSCRLVLVARDTFITVVSMLWPMAGMQLICDRLLLYVSKIG